VLAVEVDSTERADIPPFGYEIDYLTFGGIYREVQLRLVTPTFIENIFAQPKDVLSGNPSLDVQCSIQHPEQSFGPRCSRSALEASLYDGERLVAKATQEQTEEGPEPRPTRCTSATWARLLWDLKTPNLYRVEVRLRRGSTLLDSDSRRIGFREAKFTPQGFS
jgi:beta-galactosidase